jgi:hypothetical protein
MLDYEDVRMRMTIALAFMVLTACGQPTDPSSSSELAAGKSLQSLYPTSPHESLTPGMTCQNPDEYRYPEQIAYCNRSVSTGTKNRVIKIYDARFQYSVGNMPRNAFKIDHYIPLCMGGDNDESNLWPQHKSVYEITDALEQKLCMLLERAVISQAAAIDKIKYAKNHLNEVDDINQDLDTKTWN